MNVLDNSKKQLLQDLEKAKTRIAELELEQRRTQETLRLLKVNTSRYLDLAEVIIVVLDDHGNITMLGGRSCEVLGYETNELIGKNWFKTCLHSEDYKAVFSVYKQLMSGEIRNVEYYENNIRTKQGDLRHIAWHNTVVESENEAIIGTLSSGIDITERKSAEEARIEPLWKLPRKVSGPLMQTVAQRL